MFSNRVCVSVTKSLVLSDLQSSGSLTTDPIQVNGVSWCFLFTWQEGTGRIRCRSGFHQPHNSTVGVAVRASLVIESSSARFRRGSKYLLVCAEPQYSMWYKEIQPLQIELLVEDGALKIMMTLEVFKPITFRNVPLASEYSIRRPTNCVAILGIDHQGTVYVLCCLSVASPEVEEWAVYSFRPLNPDRGVILARLNVRQFYFRGSGFDPENRRLAVTQIYDNNTSLQLDILEWDNGQHTTRTYNIQEDQDLEWSAATPHKDGWVCVASGVREDPDRTVHHRFWLLDEDEHPKLVTELVEATPVAPEEMASNVNGSFYCMVTKLKCRCFMFVSSWEQPSVWQAYEMAPYPDIFTRGEIYYEWGHILTSGRIFSETTGNIEIQHALFKLRFEGVDCYLEPYLVLPKGVYRWKLGNGGFVAFTEGEKLTFYGIQPPALKTRALMDVVKLLNGDQKLAQILGQATNAIRN